MNATHVTTAAGALRELVIGADTTEADAEAAMQILGSMNRCMIGVVRFSGRTPWERHPDDELVHVLEGEVDVTVLAADGGSAHHAVRAGDVFVVPKDLWHRQHAERTTALLFVTSSEGNATSDADDPR
jgi:quercetin dioxygenase-like cupin family protein